MENYVSSEKSNKILLTFRGDWSNLFFAVNTDIFGDELNVRGLKIVHDSGRS